MKPPWPIPVAFYLEFDAAYVLAFAAVGISLLFGWHILGYFRTPPGPDKGDRP